MNEADLETILQLAASINNQPDILDKDFEKQTNFITDPARRKALFCTRRAAKSYTAGLNLFYTALKHPEANCLYIGLTRMSAKDIMWKDVLKVINRKHDLGADFNETELTVTLPNGSILKLTGVDATDDEMHKLLGKKWKLAVVDEAQSFTVDLRTLLYGILGPAVIDQGGTLCLAGTAGNLTQGLFYDVTNDKEPGWKLFEWTAHDNPYVAKQWAAEIEDIKANRPLFMQTNLYKQWFLNQWVIDEEAKVYRFSRDRNCAAYLPRDISDWHHVLGLDLAHSPDSTAFVVAAYHESDPTLYIRHVYKATKMDITDVALKIKELDARYNFEVKVVDGANKQAVAELNNRHGTGLIPADKTGKVDFILILNDELLQGKVKLLPGTEPLQEEYDRLVWITEANGKVKEPKKENPVIHQDLADAALYAWRYCYQYLFKPKEAFPDKSLQSVWEPAHIKKLEEQVKQEQNPNELDLQWNEMWDEQDQELM